MFTRFHIARAALAAAVFALLVCLAPSSFAQDTTTAQPQTQTPQATAPATQVASTPAGETAAAKPAAPLYREYRGVTLGMKADEVRAKLGRPEERSEAMDFYVFSDRERARVYYTGGEATAVIATYIGRDGGAPPPAAVLGTDVEAKPDGSMYMMRPYKQAGYWVAYSRTGGDPPMVMITMQKAP